MRHNGSWCLDHDGGHTGDCLSRAAQSRRRVRPQPTRPGPAAVLTTMSRPSWVVIVMPSVSGGSGTVGGLSSAVDSHPVRLRAAGAFPALSLLEACYGPFERRQWRLVSSLVRDGFNGRASSGG